MYDLIAGFMPMVAKILPYYIIPGAVIMCALMWLHAAGYYGWKPATRMFAIGVVVAYALEEFGVHTGLLFGRYYFTSIMGPKLDVIPIALPFGWVALIYMAWVVTNLIIDRSPVPTSHSHSHILLGAALTALVVSTIDINADPFCVANGWWVWRDGGPIFGVPVHNWVGWFIVGFITVTIHGYQLRYEDKKGKLNDPAKTPKWNKIYSIVPLVIFGAATISFILINFDGLMGLMTVYAGGIPFFVALWKWIVWYREDKKTKAVPASAAEQAPAETTE